MKKLITNSVLAAMLLVALNSCSDVGTSKTEASDNRAVFTPPVSFEEASKRADSIVSLMTLEEKLSLIKGHNGFFIKGFEKHNMPDIYLTDASQGVNIRQDWFGASLSEYALPKSVAFPNTLELAATWNPELAHDYAESIGEECRAAGIGILLGPGMNIYRQSQNGRNFEYLGEDPYLASRMVEQYIVGVQNTGVIATIKHFIANNTDYKRRASNSIVDERTLHEIYMPAFKSGVDAGAMAVMTSYNLINGEWAGQSDYVINHLLRGELDFKNLVMSDWWSITDAQKLVKSGQDLEMPGGESMGNLQTLVESGDVDVKNIDRMCTSIIRTIAQMGYLDKPIKDEQYLQNFEKHEQVALNTAREGIVLLRNENNLLPIEKGSSKNILITGMYVEKSVYGGGSGQVQGYNHVSIIEALKKEYPNITYKKNASTEELESADIVMVSVGTFDYEGSDRHFSISKEQEELVQKAAKLNSNTLVIVNSGGGIRMTDWNDVKAIVYNWYPGQMGNIALAEVLTGTTNPSGKLPMTIEKEFIDGPGSNYLPEGAKFMCDKEGYLDIDLHEPEINRWGYDIDIRVAPDSIYDVEYNEGVFVGYRWFENKQITPLFPFGFGLSYTTFAISDMQLSSEKINKDDKISVELSVSNTGKVDGATVVQLYVGENAPSVERPLKELKAFKKVNLKSGESKTIELVLDKTAFAYWNEQTKDWTVNSGEFTISAGQSSADISQIATVLIK